MPPLLLTIQTASPSGSIAITSGERLVAELNLDVSKTPTEWLLSSISELLSVAGILKTDLDAIAVVRGPGSFTGLRVGLATAKGMAMAIDCPLLGVSSLQCLAMQVPNPALPVCVMLDARKQEVYTARYRWHEGMPEATGAEQVIKPAELLDEINEETLFVGNGAMVYRRVIMEKLPEKACFAPAYLNFPRAAAAAALALREWESGRICSADQLMPNYLRPSEAELNLLNRKS